MPHPERAAVLARGETDGPVLPLAEADAWRWTADLDWYGRAVQESLALEAPLRAVRYLALQADREAGLFERVIVTEPYSDSQPPSGWTWIDRSALDAAGGLQDPLAQSALETWFVEDGEGLAPEARSPWARERSGWYAEALSWIDRSLAAAGRSREGPIVQVKAWSIACVLKAETDRGTVYFKVAADLPLFVNEARFTERLAKRMPRHAAEIIAIDAERGWLLMEDLGMPLGHREDIDEAERQDLTIQLVRQVAAMQRESAMDASYWIDSGCFDRRPEAAKQEIDTLLDDPFIEPYMAENPGSLERLRELRARIGLACDRLRDLGLPNVLVHGDLHLGNVALRGADWVVIDWTDACLAHPFADMTPIHFEKDDARRTELLSAYLSEWEDRAPRTALETAWPAGQVGFELHQSISYLHILKNLEPAARPDLDGGLSGHLRRLLMVTEAWDAEAA